MAKQNLYKIPKTISLKLNTVKSNQIIAGYVKTFPVEDISRGALAHLSVKLTDAGLFFPDSVVPLASRGKYSSHNRNGYEIIRKDLPKETHYRRFDVPNCGDRSKGTHDVEWRYEKYPREFYAPENLNIKIESPNIAAGQKSYVIKFEVEEVMDKNSQDFKDRLLKNLNILQENIGHCDVLAAGRTLKEYLETLRVSWEILPPGTREEALTRLTKGRTITGQDMKNIEDRYDFFQTLKPAKLIYGMSGSDRYFGALLRDSLVVFENVDYGNAIYMMFEDWQILSRKSRVELLSGRYGKNFERVVHRKGWKEQVRQIITDKSKPIE